MESLPESVPNAVADEISVKLSGHGVSMSAVSGTFNMIHPDPAVRAEGLRRLDALAAVCAELGTRTITLCTGTRSRASMWQGHPDNNLPDAWRDLVACMTWAVRSAERHDVILAMEPEVNNTVDSAAKARALIDQIGSPNLKVVMDGANIFHTGELPHMRDKLTAAFDLLGNDIALAHAKDLDHDGDAGHLPAGHGLLDYPHYLNLLRQSPYRGPIILHGLTEAQYDGCAAFLKSHG